MGKNVKQNVYEMLLPLEAEGFEIWHVEFAREGGEKQLRIFVDTKDGISLDGCEKVSRYLSDKLDENDIIGEAYSLVVSSPGMDRQLFTDAHFERYAGHAVEVSLYKGFDGRKRFAAILGQKTADILYVRPIDGKTPGPEEEEIAIPMDLVGKVNLMVVL